MAASIPAPSVHDLVGGEPFFTRLVDLFYDGVATDPVLLPLYPDRPDLAPARRRLTLFLIQYWGGPGTYSEQRGHPRLRMRHAPFRVGPVERDAWLGHMRRAVDSLGLDPAAEDQLWQYLERAAHFMVNTPDEDPHSMPSRPMPSGRENSIVLNVQQPGSS